MKKTEYQVIESGRGSQEVTSFKTLDDALEHMRYVDRMLTVKEKNSGSSVYVGMAEFETNGSDDRDDWEDLHDGYVETWTPEDFIDEDKESAWQREISSKLAAARRSSGTTLEELAKRIGSSRQQIAKYESGEQGMTVIRMLEIAEALSVDPIDLLPESAK